MDGLLLHKLECPRFSWVFHDAGYAACPTLSFSCATNRIKEGSTRLTLYEIQQPIKLTIENKRKEWTNLSQWHRCFFGSYPLQLNLEKTLRPQPQKEKHRFSNFRFSGALQHVCIHEYVHQVAGFGGKLIEADIAMSDVSAMFPSSGAHGPQRRPRHQVLVKVDVNVVTVVEVTVEGLGLKWEVEVFFGENFFQQLWRIFFKKEIIDSCQVTIFHNCNNQSWIFMDIFTIRIDMHWKIIENYHSCLFSPHHL